MAPEKNPKEAVLYIYRHGIPVTCGECCFLSGGNKCAVFGPTETVSPANGACGFYLHGNGQVQIPMLGFVTKLEAGYMENPGGFSCKKCKYFGNGDCEQVDKDSPGDTPGIIHPDACCNRWEPRIESAKRYRMEQG